MVSKRNPNSILSRPLKYRRIAARTQVSTAAVSSTSSDSSASYVRLPADHNALNNVGITTPVTTTISIAEPEIIDISSDEEVGDGPLDLDIDWDLSFDQNTSDDNATVLFESLISQVPVDSIDSFGKSLLYLNIFFSAQYASAYYMRSIMNPNNIFIQIIFWVQCLIKH